MMQFCNDVQTTALVPIERFLVHQFSVFGAFPLGHGLVISVLSMLSEFVVIPKPLILNKALHLHTCLLSSVLPM